MKWKKIGKIFDPSQHSLSFDCTTYAQSPQAIVLGDKVRVYFSTRKRDSLGKYISIIHFVDFSLDFKCIVGNSYEPVISLGDLGEFDEHGIFPFSPLAVGGEIWAYTCGWSRRVSVPVETSTGYAISNNGGTSFMKPFRGPILTNSLHEPILVGDSFVLMVGRKFYMWYIFGKHWLSASEGEPPARVYKIAYAISDDGVNWNKFEGKQLVSDVLGEHECQALPTVLEFNGRFNMFFCYRQASDFRTNPSRAYRLGYAFSYDLETWTRADDIMGIDISDEGWDSQMMCYPNLCKVNEKIYLLYNGNDFGKSGFGLAELINF